MLDFTGRYFSYLSVMNSLNFCLTFNFGSRSSSPYDSRSMNLGRLSEISTSLYSPRACFEEFRLIFNCSLILYSLGAPKSFNATSNKDSTTGGGKNPDLTDNFSQNSWADYGFKEETKPLSSAGTWLQISFLIKNRSSLM